MEFLTKSHLVTSTMIVINSNTTVAENIMLRDKRQQYISSGFNNDLTSTTIQINFDSTLAVSRIALIGINWKSFRVYYNGATASTFALTTTAATTTSNWSTNSETSMFLSATEVNCTSVSIDILSTQLADSEKVLGYLYVGSLLNDFDRIPSANNFTPTIAPKQQAHTLSDGSTRINTVSDKMSAKIKLKYIDASFRNELKATYDLREDFVFVAFPTTTGWDEFMFPCVWPGAFDGYTFSDNAAVSGFNISIDLKETLP